MGTVPRVAEEGAVRYDNFSAAYRGELRRLLDSSDTLTTSPRGERTRELLATRFEIAEPY